MPVVCVRAPLHVSLRCMCVWRVIIIQIFTIASARWAFSERLPIAHRDCLSSEYLLSAPICVNRCLAPAHRDQIHVTSAAYHLGIFSRFRRAAPALIVPRKQNVKSEDVIKESLEASWDASSVWTRNLWFSRQPPLIIPPLSLCLQLPFPIRLARFFHLSFFLPSFSFFFFILTRRQDFVSQH